MNRIFRRAVVAASSLGVAGGIMVTALPASAATPVRSWGASASGPVHFGEVAPATPFFTPGVASNANYTNFLTTGVIIDRASPSTAYSLVNSPLVNLSSLLATIRASQVTSYCHLVAPFVTFGGASIFSGSISQIGEPGYNPLTNPAPNTTVFGAGFSVTFNKQTVSLGVRTVTAIYVKSGSQTLSLGVSRC